MSARRLPQSRPFRIVEETPTLRSGETPSTSGEYRMVDDRLVESVGLPAARPVIRKSSSTLKAQNAVPPPRRTSVEMPAVKVPESRVPDPTPMLDDRLDFDIDASLEFDIPLATDLGPRSVQRPLRATPVPSAYVSRPSFKAIAAVAPAKSTHERIIEFANFGEPPKSIWAAPAYAHRVLKRKQRLQHELELARAKGSPDVEVYEAALRTIDSSAVNKGLAMTIGFILLALLVLVAGVLFGVIALQAHGR